MVHNDISQYWSRNHKSCWISCALIVNIYALSVQSREGKDNYRRVWITAHGKTDLVIVDGNLNSRRYIDEILRPVVVPYVQNMGQGALFQDDNCRPHRARIVDAYMHAAGTNHEGGLTGLFIGLKPYWACLGSVGKSSPHTPERGQHTCYLSSGEFCWRSGIGYYRTIFSVLSTACAADVQNVLLPVVVPPIIDVLWQYNSCVVQYECFNQSNSMIKCNFWDHTPPVLSASYRQA